MIPLDKAKAALAQLQNNEGDKLPVLLSLAEFATISKHSLAVVQNRITVHKYMDRYALKRSFYKPISIRYPEHENE